MQNKIFRDSRRVLTLLSSVCERHKVEFDDSPTQGYVTDMLMMMYYPQPIINILETRIKTVKKFETKHGTTEYWLPMLMSMQKGKSVNSAIRPNRQVPDWENNPIMQIAINRYDYITSKYLLVDYSYDEMMKLHRIVNTTDDKVIEYACNVGKQNNIFDVRYIDVVIQKEKAKELIVVQKHQELGEKIQQSNKLLNEQVHSHTMMDIAQVQYHWDKANENAKLENMFNDLTKKMGW